MTDQTVEMPAIDILLQNFVRKPFEVSGVQVTLENVEVVAAWCGGKVKDKAASARFPATKFVKVPVKRPQTPRQTTAFPGDWVLYNGTGFKVYTEQAFEASFEPVQTELPI
jgi:hypothetical protein